MIPKTKYLEDIKVIERFIEPFIHKTLQLSEDELQERSKSDRDFTFLHNIALRSRDPKLIRDQIFAVLIAGRDTTAATLSWALYELANAPAVWAKLRKEVLQRLGADSSPSYEDIKEMKYLSNILNEVLRLYPAVPYNVRTCRTPQSL